MGVIQELRDGAHLTQTPEALIIIARGLAGWDVERQRGKSSRGAIGVAKGLIEMAVAGKLHPPSHRDAVIERWLIGEVVPGDAQAEALARQTDGAILPEHWAEPVSLFPTAGSPSSSPSHSDGSPPSPIEGEGELQTQRDGAMPPADAVAPAAAGGLSPRSPSGGDPDAEHSIDLGEGLTFTANLSRLASIHRQIEPLLDREAA